LPALLPPVPGLALLATVSPGGPLTGVGTLTRVCAALFGLRVTIGLGTYDRRNSVLYRDLVKCARRAESELGIDTGAFRGRLQHRRLISHGAALYPVYGTVPGASVLAAWPWRWANSARRSLENSPGGSARAVVDVRRGRKPPQAWPEPAANWWPVGPTRSRWTSGPAGRSADDF
jgi:hypothetical protein